MSRELAQVVPGWVMLTALSVVAAATTVVGSVGGLVPWPGGEDRYVPRCTEYVELVQEVQPGKQTDDNLRLYALTAGWPCDLLDEVVAVAHCESRSNSHSLNQAGPYHGLMQLDALWFNYAGANLDHWQDPQVNLFVAHEAYLYGLDRPAGPWGPWECKPCHSPGPPKGGPEQALKK